jgi:PKHD-type hydroxylase
VVRKKYGNMHAAALVTMVVVYQNPDVRRNRRVKLNLMKRQKLNKTLKPPKDQTRLAAIQMVFTPEECLQLIAEFTPQLKPALVETMDLAQSASIRKSSAVFVFPNESTNWVFERLTKAIREINDTVYGFVVSQFKEGFQFTRYEVGEYYGPHFDIGPGRLTERKLSLTVQLSAPEEYSGGELIIYPEFVAPKDQGTMTVFPSFMCHNVNPVKTGVRYSLVSWLAGPPFK